MTDLNPLYADSCDNCVQAVAPESAIPDGTGGIVAGYRCPHCRSTWTCSWAVVPGRPLPPEPRPNPDVIRRHLEAQVLEQAAINRAHVQLAPKEPT